MTWGPCSALSCISFCSQGCGWCCFHGGSISLGANHRISSSWGGDTVQWNKNYYFQPGILLPVDLKALMSGCMLLTPEVLRRGDYHKFRYLLEIPARYICVCQLFQDANFPGSSYHFFGSLRELSKRHLEKKGVGTSIVKTFFWIFQEGVPLSLQLEVLLKSSKPAVGLNNIIFTWNFLF